MTTAHLTGPDAPDIGWILQRLFRRLAEARAVTLLSVDGMLKAAASLPTPGSDPKTESEHFSAIAATLLSGSRAAGRAVDGDPGTRQTIVELNASTIYIRSCAERSALAVLVDQSAEPSLVAHEIEETIKGVEEHLRTQARPPITGPDTPVG